MPGPRAVQNLQMPHPRDWQGGQMPHSSPGGGLGAGGIDWCIRRSTFKFGFLTYTKTLLPVVSTDFPQPVHVKSWKNLEKVYCLHDWFDLQDKFCLYFNTDWENAKGEPVCWRIKVSNSKSYFCSVSFPKNWKDEKGILIPFKILTACISSFDETTRNDRKSCPAQRGIAFASMTLLDTRIGSTSPPPLQ